MNRQRLPVRWIAGTAVAAALFLFPSVPPAHAGVIDTVRGIFELPAEVDKLKEDYDRVQQEYARTKEELNEAKQAAEQVTHDQKELMDANRRLLEQNRQLSDMVGQLQSAEQARIRSMKQLRTVLFTLIGLVIGYFLLSRILRVYLRSRL
ncbi:hypothetical protein MJA45_19040 [Paenibacillus aurantius]|uniref:Uncharacterized protein n=1 Tax=Paenibacillus aurantius TaxID=2918900 RepID=A0AA96LAS9_9BACL|nr:hypothetical protein [Paenibacillus aurantius]WNQ09709.1 hypothetical protein MJA45_19040 [Paenibacillus aurantius]